jgi:NADH:ubiquinone oxidoreductase subunit E
MGKIIVEVCVGTHCTMMGAMNIIDSIHSLEEIQRELDEDYCEVEVRATPCRKLCGGEVNGPFVRIDGEEIRSAENEGVMAAIMTRCRSKKCD